ncbi:hypothetical protein Z517_08930 [Fonsecaea pedrosoi CBS 271.37]|uniref:Unplaced genomic scaffold supercont1.5, whole genome shotgun sequence n=1 Tax=Fonsecaea pedrosoi CBS 271.37 TaxID=1442368 RepID=A0A0D2GKR5_9EURO|nr:uncharacterized protein Z517_08930 [Fonsecaea pedrosoi CBS 271.37]KIW79090.1 hypothetical protein Z517_08930 [Fonsecaea pedrosoi CBS 271.37]
MSAIFAFAKATVPTVATAIAPFAAVYYWPKKSEVFYYTPKNSTTPLFSLPRPNIAVGAPNSVL